LPRRRAGRGREPLGRARSIDRGVDDPLLSRDAARRAAAGRGAACRAARNVARSALVVARPLGGIHPPGRLARRRSAHGTLNAFRRRARCTSVVAVASRSTRTFALPWYANR